MADLDRVIYELTEARKVLPIVEELDEDIRSVLAAASPALNGYERVREYIEEGNNFDDDKVSALIVGAQASSTPQRQSFA